MDRDSWTCSTVWSLTIGHSVTDQAARFPVGAARQDYLNVAAAMQDYHNGAARQDYLNVGAGMQDYHNVGAARLPQCSMD